VQMMPYELRNQTKKPAAAIATTSLFHPASATIDRSTLVRKRS